jgi:hypothetical protein
MTTAITTGGRCCVVDNGRQCTEPSVGRGPSGNRGHANEVGELCAWHQKYQQVAHGAAQRLGERWGWTWPEPDAPPPGAA